MKKFFGIEANFGKSGTHFVSCILGCDFFVILHYIDIGEMVMNRFLIFLIILCFVGCQNNYSHEELVGTWQIVEIKSSEKVIAPNSLGANTINFPKQVCMKFPGENNQPGEWFINGDKLRLHTEGIKELGGEVIYAGHDSEWRVMKGEKYMIWRGTSRFENQHLKVILEKKSDKK